MFPHCNEDLSNFTTAIPEMHGSNSLRQLKSLCFRLTKETACSNLSLNLLKRMKTELQPYVESVNPESQIDHDLLEYKVFVKKLKNGFSQNGLRINFKIEEFYRGRLTHGGSSIAAFVTDDNLPLLTNKSKTESESPMHESLSVAGMNKTMTLACPVEDYLNGTYVVYCGLPGQCMFVNISLMFLNLSAYMDANLGFNEPLRIPIYNNIFCVERETDFKASNPSTAVDSGKLQQQQQRQQQRHQHQLAYWSKVSSSNRTEWILKKCGMPVPHIKRANLEKCLSRYQTVFFAVNKDYYVMSYLILPIFVINRY